MIKGGNQLRIDPIEITIQNLRGKRKRSFTIGSVAGVMYASRNIEETRKTLNNLIKEGLPATKKNPSIFRISRYLLTQSSDFEVQGPLTGGECEVVVILDGDEIFISIGSDHCDRELHLLFFEKPKQMCPHPIASTAWPFDEVHDHWDSLRISSYVTLGDHKIQIQNSDLSCLVDLDFLLTMEEVKYLPAPAFLFCGTTNFLISAQEEIDKLGLQQEVALGVGDVFEVELYDPVLKRNISHSYKAVPVGDFFEERRSNFYNSFKRFCEIEGLFKDDQ